MGNYWIRDAELRVLGPVSLAVLKDLLTARRLTGAEQVSRDGVTWVPADKVPDLLVAPVRNEQVRERNDAAQLRRQLTELAGRPVHEVFDVAPEAPSATYRASYYTLVRRYHPARLAPGADPELVAAYQEAFRFYSKRLAEAEDRLAPRAPAAPPTREVRTEDFVGIERRDAERVHATIRVTLTNFRMFTDHQLMNISMGGMFLATQTLLALGTLVDLQMTFEGEARRVGARARVVWESSGADARHVRGVGLKFTQLSPDDSTFIKDFVRRATAQRRT
ncbi:MAG: TIGR02266 family protein [Myxococcaceae bacterium]|nr:TIGR02266 family protein [Myxococcaceae bacterium]MCI0669043.1 TIGR02266 family protein [Myxococcaceae bacterium]